MLFMINWQLLVKNWTASERERKKKKKNNINNNIIHLINSFKEYLEENKMKEIEQPYENQSVEA